MALPGQPPTVARHEYGLTENVAAFVEQLFRAFTLPAESICHTTFGERYFTPAAAVGALAIIISAAYIAAQPADLPADVAARLPARIQQPGLTGANANPSEKQRVMKPDLPLLTFALVFLVLSGVHYGCIVRRRLKRRPYVHSRYTGQPYAILLVVTRPLAPWFTLDEREFCFKMFVEPAFVLGVALILVRLQALIFGYYLMLVAAALYFRAYLEYCRLRNQLLDMLDDMVENDFMSAAIDRQEAAEETIGFAIPGVSTVSPGDCQRLAAYRWPPSNVEQAIQGLDQTLRNLITGKEADGGEDVEKVDANETP